jgi:hypothetical protein
MANKMPPEILAHFKSKNSEDDKSTDKDKRKAALEKARQYQKTKKQK